MRILAFVTTLLLSPVAMAEGLTDLSDTERTALHAEIRAYLLENPELLLEVTEILEQRQRDEGIQNDAALVAEYRDALTNDGYSYVGGNPDGDVTIVEFVDYQCGVCKRAHPDVQALIEADPNIRLVVKELPILGPMSVTASRVAVGMLNDQGPEVYKAFTDALLENQVPLNDQVIFNIAVASGADVSMINDSADKDEVVDMVLTNRDLAAELQLTGTPSFVIGDRIVRGYVPLESMQELVEAARAGG